MLHINLNSISNRNYCWIRFIKLPAVCYLNSIWKLKNNYHLEKCVVWKTSTSNNGNCEEKNIMDMLPGKSGIYMTKACNILISNLWLKYVKNIKLCLKWCSVRSGYKKWNEVSIHLTWWIFLSKSIPLLSI
jgi:hypothetical protein